MMEEKYETTVERLKNKLKDSTSKITLTTDAWTSVATEAYLGVTCHFINDNWELTSYNLTTMPIEERHTAENIASWVEGVAEKFDFSLENVLAIVHDNAQNIVAAVRILEEKHGVASIRCAGHTFQLVVNHTMKEPVIDKALSAAWCLVQHFKKSKPASTKLKQKQKQMGTAEHKLIQDVAVRCNSAYYMINRLLEQRWPVVATRNHTAWKALPRSEKMNSGLEELEVVLKPFEQATVFLSGQSYVTGSVLSPLLKGLLKSTQKKSLSRWQKESVFKEDGENVALIAAALDPRFCKIKFLSSDDALKLQLQIQALALDIKREQQQSRLQQATAGQEASANPLPKTRSSSVLDTLLEGSNEEDTGLEDDGDSDTVRNEVLLYFGENYPKG
ncbi:hypothetical protein ABVT39_014639 [Epinephelus coioides]